MIKTFLHTIPGGVVPFVDPSTLSNLEWWVRSDSSDLAVLNEGDPIAIVQDQGPFNRDPAQVDPGDMPIYRKTTNLTPAGKPTIQFAGGDFPTGTQLGYANVNFMLNTLGYTGIMYINELALNTPGFNSQVPWDITLGVGFRYVFADHTGTFPAGHTGMVIAPANIDLGVTTLGWQMWSFIAEPPTGTGTIRIYKDGVQVASGLWNMGLQDRILMSGNPAANVRFEGLWGQGMLFSRAYPEITVRGIENWIKSVMG